MVPDLCGTTHPKTDLRHFARRLDRWTVACEAADCVYDLTVGARRVGRSLRSGGTRDTLRPDSNSQTDEQQEVVTVYNILQQGVFASNHLFFIYKWESRRHRIIGASAMEPPSVLVTPLSITLAQ